MSLTLQYAASSKWHESIANRVKTVSGTYTTTGPSGASYDAPTTVDIIECSEDEDKILDGAGPIVHTKLYNLYHGETWEEVLAAGQNATNWGDWVFDRAPKPENVVDVELLAYVLTLVRRAPRRANADQERIAEIARCVESED